MNSEESQKLWELIDGYVDASTDYFIALHDEIGYDPFTPSRKDMDNTRKALYDYVQELTKE